MRERHGFAADPSTGALTRVASAALPACELVPLEMGGLSCCFVSLTGAGSHPSGGPPAPSLRTLARKRAPAPARRAPRTRPGGPDRARDGRGLPARDLAASERRGWRPRARLRRAGCCGAPPTRPSPARWSRPAVTSPPRPASSASAARRSIGASRASAGRCPVRGCGSEGAPTSSQCSARPSTPGRRSACSQPRTVGWCTTTSSSLSSSAERWQGRDRLSPGLLSRGARVPVTERHRRIQLQPDRDPGQWLADRAGLLQAPGDLVEAVMAQVRWARVHRPEKHAEFALVKDTRCSSIPSKSIEGTASPASPGGSEPDRMRDRPPGSSKPVAVSTKSFAGTTGPDRAGGGSIR
jgi:hypothetical protein